MSAALALRDVVKRRDGRSVLDGVSATVRAGTLFGIVGPPGAGKTTLLRMVVGLLPADAGTIDVLGHDPRRGVDAIQAAIGYMPQRSGLHGHLTATENLALHADLRGVPTDGLDARIVEMLRLVGLDRVATVRAAALTPAEKQKLSLGCALVGTPRLLLLDEPTAGLDPLAAQDILRIARDAVARGATVVWATSSFDEAEDCAEVLLLDRGRAVAQLPTEPRLEDKFIALTAGVPTPLPPRRRPSAAGIAIDVRNLGRRFGSTVAVEDLTLTVGYGEIVALVGGSGSGKSTVLHMICGFLAATTGEARLAGLDFSRAPAAERSRFGYMGQKLSLYPELTVAENLRFFAGAYRLARTARIERIDRLLADLGLGESANVRVRDLMPGAQKRTSLAAALLHEPRILLLDEPTTGVDPLTRRDLWPVLTRIADGGAAILVALGSITEAQACDQLTMLHRGHVIASGRPEEITAAGGAAGEPDCTLAGSFANRIAAFERREVP